MTTTHVGRILRDRVERELDMIREDLTAGCAADYAAYRYLVGKIDGAKMVLEQLDIIEGEN